MFINTVASHGKMMGNEVQILDQKSTIGLGLTEDKSGGSTYAEEMRSIS